MPFTRPVVACVADRENPETVLRAAQKIAEAEHAPLRVITVRHPGQDPAQTAAALEALYACAKRYGAELSVYFSEDAACVTARQLIVQKARHFVVGGTAAAHSLLRGILGRNLLPSDLPVTFAGEGAARSAHVPARLRLGYGMI